MADFREELHVIRNENKDGKPSLLPYYSWHRIKIDLADNTVEIVDFGSYDSIADVCKQIEDFESTEQSVKLGIRAFLDNDSYDSSDEY